MSLGTRATCYCDRGLGWAGLGTYGRRGAHDFTGLGWAIVIVTVIVIVGRAGHLRPEAPLTLPGWAGASRGFLVVNFQIFIDHGPRPPCVHARPIPSFFYRFL